MSPLLSTVKASLGQMSASLEKAMQLSSNGRYVEALSELDAILGQNLSDGDRLDIAGNKINVLMYMERFCDAEKLAKDLLLKAPPNSRQILDLRHKIAAIRQHEGRFSEAAQEYAAILSEEPEVDPNGNESWFFDVMHFQYGICLAILGEFRPALQQLQAVRQPNDMPNDWIIEWNYYLGLCFFGMRNFEEAAASLTEVVKDGKSGVLAKALYYLAQAERENGRLRAAVEALTQLAKMAPTDIPAEYIERMLAQLGTDGRYTM